MWKDPIVDEVRKAREELASRFDYDLGRISEFLREEERKSNRSYFHKDNLYSPTKDSIAAE